MSSRLMRYTLHTRHARDTHPHVSLIAARVQIIGKYGLDPVRYFLLRDGGMVDDGDFSHDTLVSKLNNDLADTLGNLFARLTAPSLNPAGLVPACGDLTADDQAFVDRMQRLPGTSQASPTL